MLVNCVLLIRGKQFQQHIQLLGSCTHGMSNNMSATLWSVCHRIRTHLKLNPISFLSGLFCGWCNCWGWCWVGCGKQVATALLLLILSGPLKAASYLVDAIPWWWVLLHFIYYNHSHELLLAIQCGVVLGTSEQLLGICLEHCRCMWNSIGNVKEKTSIRCNQYCSSLSLLTTKEVVSWGEYLLWLWSSFGFVWSSVLFNCR